MQSITKSLVGLVLLILGIIGLSIGYSSTNAIVSALSWASLLIGGFLLVFGIANYRRMRPRKSNTPSYSNIEKRLLVQSMACVANADGKVRDIEVTAICNIHEQLLKTPIKHDEVRDLLDDTRTEDILKKLSLHSSEISNHIKHIIIQSCHLIMISDSEIAHTEENRIHDIGAAVGLTKSKVDELIAVVST